MSMRDRLRTLDDTAFGAARSADPLPVRVPVLIAMCVAGVLAVATVSVLAGHTFDGTVAVIGFVALVAATAVRVGLVARGRRRGGRTDR